MSKKRTKNLLKGQIGDEINVLMAACAWNLRKWMVAVAIFLFWKKSRLIFCKIPEVFFCC
jgi:IS5 family transposase